MLSTGDVQGGLRRLEGLLRAIKYPGHVDYSGLSKGDPSAFLPIVSFTLTSFSPSFTEQLVRTGLELAGKTDLRFTDTLYKILRDVFHYKPVLTKQQFLQWGFSQRKLSVVCDIISLVQQRHHQLKKRRAGGPASHRGGGAEPRPPHANTASRMEELKELEFTRQLVVSHVENYPTCIQTSAHAQALCSADGEPASLRDVSSSHPSGNIVPELQTEPADKDSIIQLSEVEDRLSAVEAHLERVLSGLGRLSVLEKRLEEAERAGGTDKSEGGDVITISRASWENLVSRVVLLETKLELSDTQTPASPLCQSCSSSCSTDSTEDASKEDIKDSLERITNMLRSTSSLLKNADLCSTVQ